MKWSTSTALWQVAVRAGLIIMCLSSVSIGEASEIGPLSSADKERLDHLLRHDCGSCHGMKMKGGLGPSLLPEDLRDHDEDSLVDFILFGNPQKAMPPWGELLKPHEVRWIVRRLKDGGPSEAAQ